MKMYRLYITLLVGCLVFCSCEDNQTNNDISPPPTGTETPDSDPPPAEIEVILDLPDPVIVVHQDFRLTAYLTVSGKNKIQVTQRETAELNLMVEYFGNIPVDLLFSDAQKFDFFIIDENGTTIWQWAYNSDFTQALVDITVHPQEVLVYSEPWFVVMQSGSSCPVGKYALRANWKALGNAYHSDAKVQSWFQVEN